MIEVFDENDVKECLAEVTDSDIKTYAFCLLDWAMQKRKVQAIPLDKVKQAREEIDQAYEEFDGYDPYALCEYSSRVDEILDKLIAESEGVND